MTAVLLLIAAAFAVTGMASSAFAEDATVPEEYEDHGEYWSLTICCIFSGSEASRVTWDFGDGSEPIVSENLAEVVKHTYAAPGDYYIKQTAYNTYNGGSESVAYYKVAMKGYPYIEFDSNGGSSVEKIQQTAYNVPAEKPENPVKDGFTFIAWCTDDALTQQYDWSLGVTVPVKLYAKWASNEAPVYTVTLDANGGKVSPSSITAPSHETVDLPTPTREGFEFTGWKVGSDIVDGTYTVLSNVTLTAQWKEAPKSITITFIGEDGKTAAEVTLNNGRNTYTLEEAKALLGSENVEIYTDSDMKTAWDPAKAFTADTSLYVKTVPATVTVTFVDADGNTILVKTVASGSSISNLDIAADLIKDGKIYAGLYADKDLTEKYDDKAAVDGDTTLYVKYTSVVPDKDDHEGWAIIGLAVAGIVSLIAFAYTRHPAAAVIAIALLAVAALLHFGVIDWKS